jgi:hypothetical protein
MNDPLCMGGVESVRDLDGQGKNQVRIHRTIADTMLEGHTVQILHNDEGLPIVLADLINSANIRVVQRRSSLGFALEAAERL